jgi:hypothetical protein
MISRTAARMGAALLGFSCVVQANHAGRIYFTGDKSQSGFGLYTFENWKAVPKQNWIYIDQ